MFIFVARYYGDAYAYMYADAIARSMEQISAALVASGGKIAPLQARWTKKAPVLKAPPRNVMDLNGHHQQCPGESYLSLTTMLFLKLL